MKLSVLKENKKILIISILTVIIIAGLFLSASNYLLEIQFDQPVLQEVSYKDDAVVVPETVNGYVKADYLIEVEMPAENTNALSPEDAAEEGARYLWEMMAVDLSGKTIYLQYAVDSSRQIAYWHGDIMRDGETRDGYIPEYTFSIDALSGKWSSFLFYPDVESRDSISYLSTEADEYYRENCDEFLEIAREYAARQCTSEIVSAEFKSTNAGVAPGYIYDRPTDSEGFKAMLDANQVIRIPLGEPIPVVSLDVIIYVTDAEGNRIEVTIDTFNNEVRGVNELYDGVDYFPEGLG